MTTKNLSGIFALAMVAGAWANSVDLSGPQGVLGYADSSAHAQYEINYQSLDAGDGIKLPFRYLFNSDPQAGMGWDVPLLTAHAREFDPEKRYGYIEVELICGKKLYFDFPSVHSGGGGSSGSTYLAQTSALSQDGQWYAQITGFPTSPSAGAGDQGEHDFTLTITHWDGWKLYFGHGGQLQTLTTDTSKVLNWNYNGSGQLTSITLAATNATLLSAAYSGSNLTAVTLNGDAYHPQTNTNGQLTQIEHPDGTLDTFDYVNFSSGNEPLYANTSNPSGGNASIEHTNRYGFKRKLTWDPVNHFIVSDGQWNYTRTTPTNWHTGLGPGGIDMVIEHYTAVYMKRTRIATGEWEEITFSGALDGTHTIRGIDGSETRITESRGHGPTYGKTTKVEKKIGGLWVRTYFAAYDETTGRVIRTTDAYEKDTVYTYTDHASGDLPHPISGWSDSINFAPPKTRTVTDATGRYMIYEYDVRGNTVQVTDEAGVKRSYEYDSRDRVTKVKNNAAAAVAQYAYNNNNRVTSFKDADLNETIFEYLNRYGRSWLTKVTTPTGLTREFTYDSHGNRISAKSFNGQTWTLTPNADNLLEKITDPDSHDTQFDYDSRKNLASVENALGDTTTFEYDDLDMVKKVTDALGHDSTYINNGRGQTSSLTDNRGKPYSFEYTSDGPRKKLTFPGSSTITSEYDLVARLTKKTFRDGTFVGISRDDAGRVTGLSQNGGSAQSISYDTAGRVSSIDNPVTSTESYSYNGEGQLSNITYGSDGSASMTYYANGWLKELTYPTGMVVKYEYDTEGRVSKIYKDTVLLVAYTYDTAGRLSAKAFGSTGAITEGYSYNTLNRLTSFTISGTTALWSAEYGYNAIGNRTYSKFPAGTGDVYQYDAIGQLTGVKYGVTNPQSGYTSATSPAGSSIYTYDAAGNRLTSTPLSGPTVIYTANDINQYSSITNDTPLSYDSRGNVSGRGSDSFEYDALGRLVTYKYNGTTACTYKYDTFGRRVQKYKSSSDYENHYNLGTQLLWIKKHSGSTDTNITFIYQPGIDRPVAQVETTGSTTQVYYVHRDALNSVVALSNDSGLVQTYAYDIWGGYSTAVNTGAAISRFLYTSREIDSETGMYYYRARNYSPQYGRFIQLDPVDFAGGDLNLYRYVVNSPVNFIDPFGTQWHKPSDHDMNFDNDGNGIVNAEDDNDGMDSDGDGFDTDCSTGQQDNHRGPGNSGEGGSGGDPGGGDGGNNGMGGFLTINGGFEGFGGLLSLSYDASGFHGYLGMGVGMGLGVSGGLQLDKISVGQRASGVTLRGTLNGGISGLGGNATATWSNNGNKGASARYGIGGAGIGGTFTAGWAW